MAEKQNKTERIKEYLLQLIQQDKLPPDGRLPTEKMLCEQFGVSRVPVQAAFAELGRIVNIQRTKGNGTFVKPGRPQGQKPARSPASTLIPFVMSEENFGAGFWEAAKGAEACLQENGHFLMVRYARNTPESEREVIESLIESGMRSMLVLSRSKTPESAVFYNRLIREGINLVFVDSIYRGVFGDLVSSDNVMGGYLATRHLLQNGYRRPAFLTAKKSYFGSLEERLVGYHMAMDEAGFPQEQHRVFYLEEMDPAGSAYTLSESSERFARILAHMQERPDALVCENDYMAITMYRYLQKHDLRIPQDMALVGYDNLPMMANTDVPISSVEQPFYDMGYQAAQLCLRKKEAPLTGCQHLLIPVTLKERASSAKKLNGESPLPSKPPMTGWG
ncbi:MAG: GntR family transcriptional regulator [Clostridia bacterium]|nr:GntR family transcriptional regulator [Clostridia bacterium]